MEVVADVRARVTGMTFRDGDEVYVEREENGHVKHVPSGVYDSGEIVIHVVTDTRDPRHVSPQEIVGALQKFLEVSDG